MNVHKRIRNLIIGENRYIDSYTEFKQVMLSGNFTLIAMCVLVINFLIDASLSLTALVFLSSFLMFGLSIVFHRSGRHVLANYCMLITSNFTIYLFASSESIKTGVFIHFIVITVGAFAVFNHLNRIKAVFFVGLTFGLFCLSFFSDFRILPWREYSEEVEMLSAAVNFAIALIATGMGVSLLINMNYQSARQLCDNNKLLIKTNGELDRFVYSTSHDLRAPLTSVMGLINIADDTEDTAELKRYLAMIRDRIYSMDRFIKDITDYSRNNRKEVGKESVNLKDLATEVWEELKFTPEASQIYFEIKIEEGLVVESDKSRLKIILSNLISNAIRYHDRRKEIQYIRLCHEKAEQGFYLKIEDNGQGIAPEYHQKIFDMFFRGNESSKGSGLGLYIVQETLEKLSGSISLDSKPGSGSSFTITLPKQ